MFKIINEGIFQQIIDEFTVDKDYLTQLASAFRCDMEMGLAKNEMSSLRMLPSYISVPTGKEKGEFLALDFGGTNVRVLLIELLGNGSYKVLRKVGKPLVFDGVYDFVGADANAEELFDFIAALIDEVIGDMRDKMLLLGHTFSFPSQQTNLYDACLITWTKEFAVQGVEGKIVNDLLTAALVRQGITNVRPVAVINDTVATLLAGAYQHESTYIGSIYATGHNTAYVEPYDNAVKSRMILNMESGGFNKLFPNQYDRLVDEMSEKPGEQRLEKMVAGRYLGKLFTLAVAAGLEDHKPAYSFSNFDLSAILLDNTMRLIEVKKIMKAKSGRDFTDEDCDWFKAIAEIIVIRSARLIAATYVGVMWHLNGDNINPQKIAIEGSLYEKMPLCSMTIEKTLMELLGNDAVNLRVISINDGSGIGAAIAAALHVS